MSFEDLTWLLALFAIWIFMAMLPGLWKFFDKFFDNLADRTSKK